MRRLLAIAGLLVGCDSLLGIHDLSPDATSGSGGHDADLCTGTCECRIDTDCAGDHTVCFDQTTSRTCICAAGYAMSGAGCAWTGVIADPGFADPAAWTVDGTATVDPTAASTTGMVDPGEVMFSVDPSCTGTAEVSQQIIMPRRSRAEPLVIVSDYKDDTTAGMMRAQPGFGVGSVWYQNGFATNLVNWTPVRLCLGAGQYAPESTTGRGGSMVFGTAAVPENCGFSAGVDVDHAEIAVANPGECPAPGTVPNGDAEGSGGWTFSSVVSGDFAGIATNVGQGGTHGVRLFISLRCDSASATVPVSVPVADATGSPVLSLYHSTSASYLTMLFDGNPVGLNGGVQPTVERFCVPAALRGGVFTLIAGINGGVGTCSDVVDDEADLDNVTVSNDPSCGSDPVLADPSFESGLSLIGAQVAYTASVATVADASAHDGQRDLLLSVASVCGQASFGIPVVAPAAVGSAGPAFKFWYRFPQGSMTSFTASPYTAAFTPVRDDQWHQGITCLSPHAPGRPTAVFLELTSTGSGVPCDTAATNETVTIDDLSMTTDPSCPAQ